MVAPSEGYDEPRIYALDRIRQLSITGDTFKMPRDWSAEQYFDGCFGIIAAQSLDKQIVKLRVTANQAKYFRDLPLHHSQEEIEHNDDFSIFQRRLQHLPVLPATRLRLPARNPTQRRGSRSPRATMAPQ